MKIQNQIPYVIDTERKSVTLAKEPILGDTVTAVFEVIPKETKENLKVIFFGFDGTKATTDTAFNYDAIKGEKKTFNVDIVFISTPAIFKVKIAKSRGRPNGLTFSRYLLDMSTGKYGTKRDMQYYRPLEYRFNTKKRTFEREIFRFENERWAKNRAIIDTVNIINGAISDSLALVLYADIPKANYPRNINTWMKKAKFLLHHGWSGDLNENERNNFFLLLNQKIIEEEQSLSHQKQRHRNRRVFFWSLSWLIPVILLIVVLVFLLRLQKRVNSRSITPTIFDKFVKYLIYLFIVGAAIYFAYPYLSLDEKFSRRKRLREIKKIERENWEAVEKILQLDILENYENYSLVHKSPVGTKYGIGGNFRYRDTLHSKMNIEYHFLVKVYPTKEGKYKIINSDYDFEEIERNFEENEQIVSFITKLKAKRVDLEKRGEELLVSINDTVAQGNVQYPINLQYNNENKVITTFTVPSYFSDSLFPELDTIRKRCRYAGHPIQYGKCIKYKYYGKRKQYKGYATLIQGGGSDTLWMWFYLDKPWDFGYKWIPIPRSESPPQSINEQLYYEFEKAGLPSDYIKGHLQVISSIGMRKPDYFTNEGDKTILEAQIKWNTGYEWVDKCNKGVGIRFVVSYEYSGISKQLGKCLGKPGKRKVGKWKNIDRKRFYLKPITQLISESEAREKLYSFLPENRLFSSIYVEIWIPEKKDEMDNFIFLVGNYSPSKARSSAVKVNLETGDVQQTTSPSMVLYAK